MYEFILPTIFVLNLMVGFAILLNGVMGVVRNRIFIPNLRSQLNSTLQPISDENTKKWGVGFICLGLLLISIPYFGILQTYKLMNSPAYVQQLLEPPEEYEILYSLGEDGTYEIAYGFQQDMETIRLHYADKFTQEGWKILQNNIALFQAIKDKHFVTLTFVGWQPGDNKEFKSKVIVNYRENSSF